MENATLADPFVLLAICGSAVLALVAIATNLLLLVVTVYSR
jgi:hypothetical protein